MCPGYVIISVAGVWLAGIESFAATPEPGTISSSSAPSSLTNFLSLTCSFFSPSATHTLSVNCPLFWPSSCLKAQVGFKHGLNRHGVLMCVNLHPGVEQSAPLRHRGMEG